MLRMKIDDYEAHRLKYPFGFRKPQMPERARKGIQCQKEQVATYLAGSRQGIPPLISRREGCYLRTIYFTVAWGGLRFIFRNIPDGLLSDLHDCFTRQNLSFLFAFSCSLILWTLFSIHTGDGGMTMCIAGRAIRTACKSVDQEKVGDTRKELEWWIEPILIEDNDSTALEKERREVIIAPILGLIRR
jgi:hypothetical protein